MRPHVLVACVRKIDQPRFQTFATVFEILCVHHVASHAYIYAELVSFFVMTWAALAPPIIAPDTPCPDRVLWPHKYKLSTAAGGTWPTRWRMNWCGVAARPYAEPPWVKRWWLNGVVLSANTIGESVSPVPAPVTPGNCRSSRSKMGLAPSGVGLPTAPVSNCASNCCCANRVERSCQPRGCGFRCVCG